MGLSRSRVSSTFPSSDESRALSAGLLARVAKNLSAMHDVDSRFYLFATTYDVADDDALSTLSARSSERG